MTDTSKPAVAAVVERLRTKASMIMLGEPIAWGSDSAVMDEAASLISALEAERDGLYSGKNVVVAHTVEHAERLYTVAVACLKSFGRDPEAQVAALEAELENAAEALEPFSKAETDITSQLMLGNLAYSIVWPDDMPIGLLWDADDTDKALVSVTWGDLRRAASTLSTLRETTDA